MTLAAPAPAHRVDPPDARDARKVAVAAAVGATIEWYDFFLYGTAAGLVFDKLFFSGLDGPAAQFAAFGTFAVGFVARPVGGLIFGHFGDRVGRKKMLIWTLVIMGAGTAAIGLLPSYDSIGVWAPVLLVLLRILQGIGVGGEYGGAVLLAVEFAPAERRGFFGSFAHIGVPGGLFLASGAFAIASQLPDEDFLAWGWRVCFLVSIVLLAGLVHFVIAPAVAAGSWRRALGVGAFFGLVVYGVYELTNWAVLADWPAGLVPIDIAWGMFLSASVSVGTYAVVQRLPAWAR